VALDATPKVTMPAIPSTQRTLVIGASRSM
jgi:hypothetical protein